MKSTSRTPSLLLMLIFAACASGGANIEDVPAYREYIQGLVENIESADENTISASDKSEMLELANGLLSELSDVSAINELEDEAASMVFDQHERLHAMLLGEDESQATRRVCKTETPIGSNIRKRTCRTVASITNDREAARRLLMVNQHIRDQLEVDNQIRQSAQFGIPLDN